MPLADREKELALSHVTGSVSFYTPAGLSAWLAVTSKNKSSSMVLPSATWRVALVQTVQPDSWAGYVDGKPVALAGIWHDKEFSEMWFVAGSDTARHMLPLIKGMRIVVQKVWRRKNYPRLIVRVKKGHRPGDRIAQLMGFEFFGKVERGMKIWEM